MREHIINCITVFNSFISSLNIDDQLKLRIKELLLSEDNISHMRRNGFQVRTQVEEFYTFMEYVYKKHDELGDEYISDAIRYAFTYGDDNSNFINQFIKFIVVTNFDEIEVVNKLTPETKDRNDGMCTKLYLGGLELSHNENIEYHEKDNYYEFSWLHNRRGLIGTKLGRLSMVSLLEGLKEQNSNFGVYAYNVQRTNQVGLGFYKKFGFDVVDYNPNAREVAVVIQPERIDECIRKNSGQFPVIYLDDREIDYTTYKGNDKQLI